MKPAAVFISLWGLLAVGNGAAAPPLLFPTANRALLEPDAGDRFFVGTVGKPWTSGTFGCVRTDGRQIHEGLDIKCLERDRRGEPTDPVLATADGTVVYFSVNPGLSNYGRYLILRHQIEGLEIYSLYAHLREIRGDLRIGQTVGVGEPIATMGRSTNTSQGISKERAHVHFELNLLINERFPAWYQKAHPDQRNDHGPWNGQNLLGLDPRIILLEQAKLGAKFSLLEFVRNQTDLCRLVVRDTNFPWLKRYPLLIRRNSQAEKEGVAGYEIALNYNGLPFQLIPRSPTEIPGQSRFQLLSVNENEQKKHPCRHLLVKRGTRWELAPAGIRLLELLTF